MKFILKLLFILSLHSVLQASEIDFVAETQPVRSIGDAADDPAIWFNAKDPSKSLIFGTDKGKGIHVYDLNGKELSFSKLGATNNIDLRVIDERVHIVVSNRSMSTLDYWVFNEDGLFDYFLTNPDNSFNEDSTHYHLKTNMDVYGVCMGLLEGRPIAAITQEEGPNVQIWDLLNNTITHTFSVIADEKKPPLSGNEAEGCVFDDENHVLLVSREGSRGYLKAYNTKDYSYLKTVDSRDQNIVGDPEGVTIYKTSTTEGYVLLSSQGGNEFNVYDRKSLKFIKKFTVNNVQDTDGIDVISKKVNEMFPRGFLVVQDGRNLPENQNFKIVSMDEVLKKKLNHPG